MTTTFSAKKTKRKLRRWCNRQHVRLPFSRYRFEPVTPLQGVNVRDRAYRRFQHQKKIEWGYKMARRWDIKDENVRYPEGTHGWVVRTAESMPTCSRPCCGNQRRHFGHITRQEIQANDAEREQRHEL